MKTVAPVFLLPLFCFFIAISPTATFAQGSGSMGGGSGSGGSIFCPFVYLFNDGSTYFYRLKDCSRNAFAYEGFGDEVSALGCDASNNCECGCMPNQHNPNFVDETTEFNQQAGLTSLEFGAAYVEGEGTDNLKALSYTFPGQTEAEYFRLVRIQVAGLGSKTWIGLPTESDLLKGLAADGATASQSASGTSHSWTVTFNAGTVTAPDNVTAWVMRRD